MVPSRTTLAQRGEDKYCNAAAATDATGNAG